MCWSNEVGVALNCRCFTRGCWPTGKFSIGSWVMETAEWMLLMVLYWRPSANKLPMKFKKGWIPPERDPHASTHTSMTSVYSLNYRQYWCLDSSLQPIDVQPAVITLLLLSPDTFHMTSWSSPWLVSGWLLPEGLISRLCNLSSCRGSFITNSSRAGNHTWACQWGAISTTVSSLSFSFSEGTSITEQIVRKCSLGGPANWDWRHSLPWQVDLASSSHTWATGGWSEW